jgi:hypothetical protein
MPPPLWEDDMKTCKSILVAAIVTLASLALPAAAGDLPIGIADSKNLVQRTVTIDDQTFKVTDRTEIFDLSGLPLRFENVGTAADQGPIVELDRITYAYDAEGDVLVLLRAVPLPR